MAATWSLVVASKGAPDHGTYTAKFDQEAEELVEDFEDGGCTGTDEMDLALKLKYQTTLVAVPKALSPPQPDADEADYEQVARDGNTLFKVMRIPRAQFISVSCVGQVDQSADCAGLS
jgi:hypothetical protein